MVAMKFHHLPFASWRTRKASGVIQSKSKGLRTRKDNGVGPSSTLKDGVGAVSQGRQEKMDGPAQTRRKFTFRSVFLLFIPFRPSADWMRPAHFGEHNLLYFFTLPIQTLISSTNILRNNNPEIMLCQLSGIP